MTTRFVQIPAAEFVSRIEKIGDCVAAKGGHASWTRRGHERVYLLALPKNPAVVIEIYTTIPAGGTEVRDRGKDAVRFVVKGNDKPLGREKKMLRTAPTTLPEAARVEAFLDRFTTRLREVYATALKVRPCRRCGAPTAVRKGCDGKFLGCTNFPECRETASL